MQEDELIVKKPWFTWNVGISLSLLVIFLSVQSVTISGFCYLDYKFLTEREMIDRYLVLRDTKARRDILAARRHATDEKRAEIVEKNLKTYADCCNVMGVPADTNVFEIAKNSIIFNRRVIELKAYFHEDQLLDGVKSAFQLKTVKMDSCASKIIDETSEDISAEVYNAGIAANKNIAN